MGINLKKITEIESVDLDIYSNTLAGYLDKIQSTYRVLQSKQVQSPEESVELNAKIVILEKEYDSITKKLSKIHKELEARVEKDLGYKMSDKTIEIIFDTIKNDK